MGEQQFFIEREETNSRDRVENALASNKYNTQGFSQMYII